MTVPVAASPSLAPTNIRSGSFRLISLLSLERYATPALQGADRNMPHQTNTGQATASHLSNIDLTSVFE
jgi:hypothetical protein